MQVLFQSSPTFTSNICYHHNYGAKAKVCPSFSDAAKRFILSHAEMKPKNILKSVLNPVVDKIS